MEAKEKNGLVAHYLSEFAKKQSETKGRLIFRGLTNEAYGIQSSAGRRLKKEEKKKQSDFIRYHINLIENARKYGYGVHHIKRELSDLEVLAEIQHYGGATCLTDFSTNFLIALWFATGKGQSRADGKVVWMDLGEKTNLKLITYYNADRNEKSIQQILTRVDTNFESRLEKVQPIFWLWEPTKLNNRITKQDSVFLFSLRRFPKTGSEKREDEAENNLIANYLVIKEEDKKAIREELEVFFGISAETIFYDFSGYSLEANGAGVEVSENLLSNKKCLFLAKENIKKGKYSLAVSYLDDAIKCKRMKGAECNRKADRELCNTSIGEIMFWRACANFSREYNDEAAMNYFESTLLLDDKDYQLKCEGYRKLSVLHYEKQDFNAAIKADENLWHLYKKNKRKGISDQDGIDGIFALIELSIMQLNEEKYTYYLNEAMYIEKILENPDNGRILLTFLRIIGDLIFYPKKRDFMRSYQEIKENIEGILLQLDKEEEAGKKYIGVIGYYYWNYNDIINWIKGINRIKGEMSDLEEYISKHADDLIILAKKAADGQNKLLNRMFSKSLF